MAFESPLERTSRSNSAEMVACSRLRRLILLLSFRIGCSRASTCCRNDLFRTTLEAALEAALAMEGIASLTGLRGGVAEPTLCKEGGSEADESELRRKQ